jgi:chromosome segregation ATPase
MKRALLMLFPLLVFSGGSAFAGASKEMLELQTQMQILLQTNQKTNEEMGVLRDKVTALVQQTTDSLSRVSGTMEKLEKSLQQQQAATDSCVDQLAGQTQPVHDELTELRSRIDAVARQLNEMNSMRQSQEGSQNSPGNPANAPSAKGPGAR